MEDLKKEKALGNWGQENLPHAATWTEESSMQNEEKLILIELLKKPFELSFSFKIPCWSFLCEKQSAC